METADKVIALVPGKYYRFNPPVEVMATAAAGSSVCEPAMCVFTRGRYFARDRQDYYVFKGWPINDYRSLVMPQGYSLHDEHLLRECLFKVELGFGISAMLDPDQSDH